jgi:hypothetical protein
LAVARFRGAAGKRGLVRVCRFYRRITRQREKGEGGLVGLATWSWPRRSSGHGWNKGAPEELGLSEGLISR